MKHNFATLLLVGFAAFAMTGSALAKKPGGGGGGGGGASLPSENLLDTTYYDNLTADEPRIEYGNIALNYNQGGGNGKNKSGTFTASTDSAFNPTFTLYDGQGGSFDISASTDFLLTVKLDRNTAAVQEGTFSFVSTDAMFGFGIEEVCNRKGKGCRDVAIAGEVFGGTVSDFGWSSNDGYLEFETGDFTGWACDQGWCTDSERLWFNVDGGTLGLTDGLNKVTSWDGVGSGAAVIPVPAAVWLFGSGLLGLVGVARRKKS